MYRQHSTLVTRSTSRLLGGLVCTTALVAGLAVGPAAAAAASAADSPVGTWRTSAALVQVSADANGVLSVRIIKQLDPNAPPDPRCTECTDARKNQPIIGMTFIDGVKPTGDGWDGGTVLNPADGKTYRCKMQLHDDGKTLEMRGYVGTPAFGTSQTWTRVP